jgi:hypothetical protein
VAEYVIGRLGRRFGALSAIAAIVSAQAVARFMPVWWCRGRDRRQVNLMPVVLGGLRVLSSETNESSRMARVL